MNITKFFSIVGKMLCIAALFIAMWTVISSVFVILWGSELALLAWIVGLAITLFISAASFLSYQDIML